MIGAAAATAALPSTMRAVAKDESFQFLFLTDTHIMPELDAAHGTDMAMKQARAISGDFVIQGGDHVYDSLGVNKARATALFDLYDKTEQDLGLKVHHTVGNHDCFGVFTASGVETTDPEYGKKMFSERFGPTYYSFDHKGVHFIVLDSIGITPERGYIGQIGDEELVWLGNDLALQGASRPIIVTTHMPLVTAVPYYADSDPKRPIQLVANGPEAIKLFEGHNVLAVLQGHTHVNERVEWRGVSYLTSGAVCGNWWQGTRWGTPEGFTVVNVSDGKVSTRYQTTGFKAVDPKNT